MEAEVVQMCVNMFKGGKDACGTVMTSNLLFLSPLVTFCQRNYIIILYLLVYNACLCIKRTYFGLHFEKENNYCSQQQKTQEVFTKNWNRKIIFCIHFKRCLNHLFGNVTPCTSDPWNNYSRCSFGFFWLLIIVKSWVPSTIHCIQKH